MRTIKNISGGEIVAVGAVMQSNEVVDLDELNIVGPTQFKEIIFLMNEQQLSMSIDGVEYSYSRGNILEAESILFGYIDVYQDGVMILHNVQKLDFKNAVVGSDGKIAFIDPSSAVGTGINTKIVFFNGGGTANKWLTQETTDLGSSYAIPYVLPFSGVVTALTYMNSNNGSDIDLEFYINGTDSANRVFTWEVRDKRWAFKRSGMSGLSFSPGDHLHVYAKGVGLNPADVIINVYLNISDNGVTDGGDSVL